MDQFSSLCLSDHRAQVMRAVVNQCGVVWTFRKLQEQRWLNVCLHYFSTICMSYVLINDKHVCVLSVDKVSVVMMFCIGQRQLLLPFWWRVVGEWQPSLRGLLRKVSLCFVICCFGISDGHYMEPCGFVEFKLSAWIGLKKHELVMWVHRHWY